VDVVVIDSVAALVPRQESEGDMGDPNVGLPARLMAQALRKLTGAVGKSKTICVFINQIREKVGVIYGSPETTSGGRALKFYSSVRLEVRKGEAIKQGSEVIGSKTKVKVVKNKVAPPFKQAEFDIMYGLGVSREGCVLDMAAEMDIVKRSGTWYSYAENRIGQGRENAKQYLKENPAVMKEIEEMVREGFQPGPARDGAVVEDDDAE
jgi:recombination protein RecA